MAQLKIKFPILAFLCCGQFVKNPSTQLQSKHNVECDPTGVKDTQLYFALNLEDYD